MRQRIGILLDSATFKGILLNKTGYESLNLYNKAAEELMLKPFYMTLHKIRNKTAVGFAYNGTRYKLEKTKLPSVTHNRAITLISSSKSKLSKLAENTVLFNRFNRYSKHRIHRILIKKPELRQYMPHTVKYSIANLERFAMKYTSIYIKPSSGSVGEGIIKMSQVRNGMWKITLMKGKSIIKSKKSTLSFINNFIGNKKYIIQETIPLALYKNRPYDLRVSVQRGIDGNWKVTGIVGKVAAKGRHVTNVAKGGRVRRYEELFQESGFPVLEAKETIRKSALQIAQFLGETIPHLADIGLDMGLDKDGKVKFIEMNARDQRITFKKAKLFQTFYKTYLTPLQYGKYLLEARNKVSTRN
ncbi:YheC/YheD family protein [Paenibacillus planticolens]|uniref:ATP-grasp domain-containing protein n=1 Tax=Paenibacillus planticolens TaxID=2654976 RepID=A0ABX1ZQI0_9BACL|nr:YheC/YheD family protein [Paenibacillus planticolens]NOV02334.1 hypothetical protein [Paenibacillus planticolens]